MPGTTDIGAGSGQQLLLSCIPPREVIEGYIVEHPIWRASTNITPSCCAPRKSLLAGIPAAATRLSTPDTICSRTGHPPDALPHRLRASELGPATNMHRGPEAFKKMMASDDTQQRQLVLLPPRREILTSEGNVADWPLFVLNSKQAHPRVNLDGLSSEAARLKLITAYRREVTIAQTDSTTSRRIEKTCIISASPDFGFPGDLGQRVFYTLVGLWVEQDRADDPRVYVSPAELCRRLGLGRSGKAIENVLAQLRAMKAQQIEFRNAWRSKETYERRTRLEAGSKTVSLIADWSIGAEEAGRRRFTEFSQVLAKHDASGAEGPAPLPWIMLGAEVHQSLRGRYILPADPEYMSALKPTARRLYFLYNKRMGTKWSYAERLATLALRLPLDGRGPYEQERTLVRALEELTQELLVGANHRRVRFLQHYVIEGGARERVEHGKPKGSPGTDGRVTSDERVVTIYFEGRTPVAQLLRQRGATTSAAADPSEDAE